MGNRGARCEAADGGSDEDVADVPGLLLDVAVCPGCDVAQARHHRCVSCGRRSVAKGGPLSWPAADPIAADRVVAAAGAAVAAGACAGCFVAATEGWIKLFLGHRKLRRLPSTLPAAVPWDRIVSIDVSHNSFADASFLPLLPCLQSLVLDHNRVSDESEWPSAPTLRVLSLNANDIHDAGGLLRALRRSAPGLIQLSLLRNPGVPCSLDTETSGKWPLQPLPSYSKLRREAAKALPELLFYDSMPLEEERRELAMRKLRKKVSKEEAAQAQADALERDQIDQEWRGELETAREEVRRVKSGRRLGRKGSRSRAAQP
eukprot:TRINITY_DN4939_c0_g1_i1.p1 TRINITY_DN4939_c0_g1~~TRINITY_DN4939_c0_g1_i1.p1  ORF type:complete len:338 (+),score=98.74 TRINITY_DN4939_c0_g1_i1:64-1014(+)